MTASNGQEGIVSPKLVDVLLGKSSNVFGWVPRVLLLHIDLSLDNTEHGTDVNLVNQDGASSLSLAIQGGSSAIALKLLGRCANPNLMDNYG